MGKLKSIFSQLAKSANPRKSGRRFKLVSEDEGIVNFVLKGLPEKPGREGTVQALASGKHAVSAVQDEGTGESEDKDFDKDADARIVCALYCEFNGIDVPHSVKSMLNAREQSEQEAQAEREKDKGKPKGKGKPSASEKRASAPPPINPADVLTDSALENGTFSENGATH